MRHRFPVGTAGGFVLFHSCGNEFAEAAFMGSVPLEILLVASESMCHSRQQNKRRTVKNQYL